MIDCIVGTLLHCTISHDLWLLFLSYVASKSLLLGRMYSSADFEISMYLHDQHVLLLDTCSYVTWLSANRDAMLRFVQNGSRLLKNFGW